jgi:hypothetical protein
MDTLDHIFTPEANDENIEYMLKHPIYKDLGFVLRPNAPDNEKQVCRRCGRLIYADLVYLRRYTIIS